MGLKNPFKLEKLTITAYKDKERTQQVGKPFIAMFNPESYSQKYAINYGNKIGKINNQKVIFARNETPSLSIKLVLDGTGSQEAGMTTDTTTTVAERIGDLLTLSYNVNGDIREPNFLIVSWGKPIFSCRLSSLDINYTSFNPDGTPLRADLSLEFFSDEKVDTEIRKEDKKSPDITHSRTVESGDNINLLSKEVYGSSSHYLWIAEQNQLDDFRNLTPGQQLLFPPLPSSLPQ